MKFLDEYRDAGAVKKLLQILHGITTRKHSIMEICGGQTHSLLRYGLQELMPDKITMIHGPGCPVCVTPSFVIDMAIEAAMKPEVLLFTFGDMMRVPGSSRSLLETKAAGAQIRPVYSPLEAVRYAESNPEKEVVFLAIGFETTMPANALAAQIARKQNLKNFSLLVSHVAVPPAVAAIMKDPETSVNGLLAPGHVCAITGISDYQTMPENFGIPVVVTGFEPLDLLHGIVATVKQLEAGKAEFENQYSRIVKPEGNPQAIKIASDVFEPADMEWRGMGIIPEGGMKLKSDYADFNAQTKLNLNSKTDEKAGECISGEILKGIKKPHDCPAFGTRCKPEHPLGAPMVSNEGACSAYYQHAS